MESLLRILGSLDGPLCFLSAKVSLVRVAMEPLCSASPSGGHPPLLSSASVSDSVDGVARESQGRHALKTGDLLGRLFWVLVLLWCISGSAAQKIKQQC